MFNAHLMIARHGVDHARRMAATKAERACIEAAVAVSAAAASDEAVHGALAAACPPHRRLSTKGGEASSWTRQIGDLEYRLRSGCHEDGAQIGVPFGAKARIILLYLYNEAIRRQSRAIEVAPSMNALMRRLGMESGGMSYKVIAEQARRIATCSMTVNCGKAGDRPSQSFPLVEALVFKSGPKSAFARDLFDYGVPAEVILSEALYDHIRSYSAAMSFSALRQICDNSWAIDLYVWLSHQLPRLEGPFTVPWGMLESGFATGYKHARQMKATFLSALQLVLAVYPQAQVEIVDQGFIIRPSPPAFPGPAS